MIQFHSLSSPEVAVMAASMPRDSLVVPFFLCVHHSYVRRLIVLKKTINTNGTRLEVAAT